MGIGDWGCTEDKRLAAQNPNRTHLLKLGVGDLLGGDMYQSGGFSGAGGREGLR